MADARSATGDDTASQAREAQRSLNPLLRRRGTSVEVGQRLRRAVQHLDKALSAPEVASNEIRSAVVELTACADAIHASDRKSDHDQLAGLNAALAALGNPRSARTGTLLSTAGSPLSDDVPVVRSVAATAVLPSQDPLPLLPATALLVEEAVHEPEPPAPPIARAPEPPAIPRAGEQAAKVTAPAEPAERHLTGTVTGHGATVATVLNLCSRVSALHRRRLTLLHDVGTTWGDLSRIESELARCALALNWSVGSSLTGVEESGAMTSELDPIDQAIALLHVGGAVATDQALAAARESCRDERNATLFADALRFAASDGVLAKARDLFDASAAGPLRTALVPFLAERASLSSEDLIGLARDARDPSAPAAIYAIAHRGRREQAAEVAAFGMSLPPDQEARERADALAFASTVLGERSALNEVRRRVSSAPEARAPLVDALAVAGDESDAERLLDLAARGGPEAVRATLAASHLGTTAILPRLEALKALFGEDLVDRAKTAIIGDPAASPEKPARLLRGRSWTAENAAERLEDPSELVLSQTWIALEISVRTGIPMPAPLQSGASAKQLTAMAADWRSTLRQVRLPRAGQWLYFGKPMSRSG